eukprot:11431-Heterococcus_DN1.PRE.3
MLCLLRDIVAAAGKAMDLTLTDFKNIAFDVAVDKASACTYTYHALFIIYATSTTRAAAAAMILVAGVPKQYCHC